MGKISHSRFGMIMENRIRLLPDHLANQIAAGEVVQRPASVVKELLENAVDAGATRIELIIRDAGKALVQVMDNGGGMSPADARMSFERHATSKIKEQNDLFNIRTLGFRGEALASIAAVAQVTMKTKQEADELGTEIRIEAGALTHQGPVTTATGTSIAVKNLFFNVPARRNFLKSNPVETKHIINELIHIAVANPQVAFYFTHNDVSIYELPAEAIEKRLVRLWGNDLEGNLLPVGEATSYLKIKGFVGNPETARKARGEQLFFVNNRFIRNHYLQHAVTAAFQSMVPEGKFPIFAIHFELDPKHVDINIHPTKTEVKFDDERAVYLLLSSVVRKGLGAFHFLPEIGNEDKTVANVISTMQPTFKHKDELTGKGTHHGTFRERESAEGWEKLFTQEKRGTEPAQRTGLGSGNTQQTFFQKEREGNFLPDGFLVQLQGNYLLTQVKSGLMVIDPVLAHQRILYERFMASAGKPPVSSQQMLFPQTMQFALADMGLLMDAEQPLRHLGFDFKKFNPDSIILNGTPPDIHPSRAEELFREIIAEARLHGESFAKEKALEKISRQLSVAGAMRPGTRLSPEEARRISDELFACKEPRFAPNGKAVFTVFTPQDISTRFEL